MTYTKEEVHDLLAEDCIAVTLTRADLIFVNSFLGIFTPAHPKAVRKFDKKLAQLLLVLWSQDIITLQILDEIRAYSDTTEDMFANLGPRDILKLHPEYPGDAETPHVSFGNNETDAKEEFIGAIEQRYGKEMADKFRDTMYQ